VRVGVIGPTDADMFADNICCCLPDLGVDAVALGPCRRDIPGRRGKALLSAIGDLSPGFDERLQGRIVTRALEADVDLVISVEGHLHPEAVRRLRVGGIRVVLWFPDAVSSLGLLRLLAAQYDRMYFKDPALVARLGETYGLSVAYLPEACNPRWHRPLGSPAAESTVAVVGNMYVTRVHLLNRLAADGVPLQLYGIGWPRVTPTGPATALPVRPAVFREKKSQVFRQSAAVLNNLHPAEMESVNCRLFEATAAGGAVLCEDRPVLRDLFDVGTEVLAFSRYDTVRQQIDELLEDPGLTTTIGDAAARRALEEHTYQHRLRAILTDCA
jgi:spore maturation protein CgeB